jgi:ATP-dependent DNA helicase RecQ
VKILIVAKTRRGGGACVGGITEEGKSVRLIAADAETNQHAGLEYEVGEVWDIDWIPDPQIKPPHVENIIVLQAQRLRRSQKLAETIHRFMPPVTGGPEHLFSGLTQVTPAGGLYIAKRTGLPNHSTTFWVSDKPLRLDCEGKRIRYRYPDENGGRTLTFVGFQEPLAEIPTGTLLRVSLAHSWRPQDRPEEELRCFVQLSGWFLPETTPATAQTRRDHPRAALPDPVSIAQGRSTGLERARQVLKQTFGFSDFLPPQAEVVTRVLRKQDTLIVMPTGGGKSLCYQLPALLFEGLTVVVSPLVALMQDQVRQLREVEVPAACLNHTVPLRDYTAIANRARQGSIRLLYVAPETLLRPETLLLLEQSHLACLAIDEAHCISEWGHDFRPEYRKLQSVRQRFPQAACLMLTATATPRVREDIRRLLHIPAEGEFVASFNRPNLFLAVEPRHRLLAQVLGFLQSRRGECGIIYCGKRRQVDELCEALNANGWPTLPYHAGLDAGVRQRNQDQFTKDQVPLMVATIAFGMGINKANVRFVIHAHLPRDLEGYYQEIGRAGRDGLRAQCLLLYSRADAFVHRHFIDQGAASERPGRNARLEALMRFAEVHGCRRVPLLAYFGERLASPCGHCDNCRGKAAPGEALDVTVDARKFFTCVQATGEVFGQAHIIAVLRGSKGERVLARRHDRLSVYGAGEDRSQETWRHLAQQFLQLGFIEQNFEFGSLRLTPKGLAVLQDKESVRIPNAPAAERPEPAAAVGQHDPGLFERLRQLRLELARQARVPPYVIFSDRALIEMATRPPQDESQFLAVNGVGEVKLAKYGKRFLELIRDYSRPQKVPAPPDSSHIIRPATHARFHHMGKLFSEGLTLERIAALFQIKPSTVLQNLDRFLQAGGRIEPGRLLALSRLPESERARVLETFERLGHERLSPVHEALCGTIGYDELHLLRLYLLSRNASARPGD